MQYTYCPISQEIKAIKFVQLIEYIMRKIFLKKSYTRCRGETTPRPFSCVSLDH